MCVVYGPEIEENLHHVQVYVVKTNITKGYES